LDGTVSSAAARRRVAVEMIAKHERALRRTARRYSICAADADDALQRALEILLTKAPPGEARELVRWMQTVTKHEALAVRRSRERQLGPSLPAGDAEETVDWVSLIPATGAGPAERAESREEVARTREGLKALKPAELRALTLLAQGYSYAEIGEITGWTRTKINRALAEGRERFRAFISRSEAGGRCAELAPLLSAFCDGEAGEADSAVVREHLRACAHCRAAIRAYRAVPRAARALVPVPAGGALLGRLHEAIGRLHIRLPGQARASTESAATQVAATGGARGAGFAGLAKLLAICAGTAGGAAACAGAGIIPTPLDLAAPPKERVIARPAKPFDQTAEQATEPVAAEAPGPQSDSGEDAAPTHREPPEPQPEPEPESAPETGAVEYPPPPAPPAPEPASAASEASGSPAGEFGP
jgi:RNA polymerase sigma factor (sigma-70 family)